MPYFWILIGPLFKFKCQSSRTYRKVPEEQHAFENKKNTIDLRGLCLIHANSGADKCKLVQSLVEIQLANHLSPCDIFLFTLLKYNLS